MTSPARQARDRLGSWLHGVIDARIAHRSEAIVGRAVAAAREVALRDHQVFGPAERLSLHPDAQVNDALFNTVSGTITVGEQAFFGHGVALLTGTHDITRTGAARRAAIPSGGRDISVEPGAWVSSRATIIGPCVVGRDAVVCAGAVVTEDVPEGAVVGGVPARVIGSIRGGVPAAVDAETDVGRLFLHAHDEVLTPDIQAAGGMTDPDLALLRELAKPGDTVLDVGANVGYGTLAAARAVGPDGAVIAIEPHPDNLWLLRANVARHGAAHVRVVAGAAWDLPGAISLAQCESNTGDHRAGTVIEGRRRLRVPAVTLDDVAGDAQIAVVKLDTQATEHIAMRGARRLVERDRPVILTEFWPQGIRERGDDPAAVLSFFAGLGYGRRIVEDEALDEAGDAALIAAVHARPAPFGGFVTLRLDPLQ